MKKIQPILVAIMLSISALAYGETSPLNGNFWQMLDDKNKIFFSGGILNGAELGGNIASLGCYRGNFTETSEGLDCSIDVQQNYFFGSKRYLQNTTTNQVKDGLDVFYSDYKNRSILVIDAVKIILRQIAGDPGIDIIINNAKARAASQ